MASLPSVVLTDHTTQLGVICKPAEGALDPIVYVIVKDTKQHWSQDTSSLTKNVLVVFY